MPDEKTPNLPILDDIIKPGDTGKAVQRPTRNPQAPIEAPPSIGPESAADLPNHRPGLPRDPTDITEPFLEDVIASYRPNIDSLTDEILASIMAEMEPLIRERIRQSLERHFPNPDRNK